MDIKKYFCPECKKELKQDNNKIICFNCQNEYKITNGIAVYGKDISETMEKYWENYDFKADLIENCLEEFIPKNKKYKNILDLGCGDGRGTVAISHLGAKIFCLDTSFNLLKILKLRNLPNIIPINGDGKKLPFPDNYFDLIISISTVEHINYKDLSYVFDEVCRVLKKDGLFLVRNDAWFYGVLEKLRILPGKKKFTTKPDLTHINMMTPWKFKKALKNSNLKIIQEDYFPFYRYQKNIKRLFFPKFLVSIFATHANLICKPIKK